MIVSLRFVLGIAAAAALLGTLAPGAAGDAAVLDVVEGTFDYVDVLGEHLAGERRLEVRHVVVGGTLWHSAEATA